MAAVLVEEFGEGVYAFTTACSTIPGISSGFWAIGFGLVKKGLGWSFSGVLIFSLPFRFFFAHSLAGRCHVMGGMCGQR